MYTLTRVRRRKEQALRDAIAEAWRLSFAGAPDEFLRYASRAVAEHPDEPDLRLAHATALWRTSLVDEAKAEAVRAFELIDRHSVRDVVLLTRAARLLLDLGDIEAARSCVGRVEVPVAGAPVDRVAAREIAGIRGSIAARDGDLQAAEADLRTAYDADPGRAWFAGELAAVLGNRGKLAAALAVLDQALEEQRASRHAPEELKGLTTLRREIDTRMRNARPTASRTTGGTTSTAPRSRYRRGR